jgi:hypothetical protein
MNDFKLQLDFASFFKLSSLLGLCGGIGSAPLSILVNWQALGVNAIFLGVIGFPAYYWLSRRVGLRLRGRLFPLAPKA